MNKEYIYVNGKIVVSDEKGMKEPIEYTDNLDEILVSQNLIEKMEMKQQKLKDNLELKICQSKSKRDLLITSSVMILLCSLIIPTLFTEMLGINGVTETIFGSMNNSAFMTITMLSSFTIIGLPISFLSILGHMSSKKEINGLNSEIDFLNSRIAIEKDRLTELQNVKANDKEESIKQINSSIKVNDKEALEKLRTYLQLYYDCGYNKEKYTRYYSKGKLPEKLSRNYDDSEKDLVEKYIREQGYQKTL